jgi:anti-sigma regulatory factor (Ser/Thr protein kinase)
MPLSGDVAEIRTVRRCMRELLEADAWDESDVDAILLSASEMVHNAFSHAEPPFVVQATIDRDAVIEVRDGGGDGWPRLRATPPSEPGGKGLFILQALAAQWTTRRNPDGKSVLARFERHEHGQPDPHASSEKSAHTSPHRTAPRRRRRRQSSS